MIALWAAAMVLCAAVVPRAASLLGYHAAGAVWAALQLSVPLLSQAGDVCAGAIGGLVVGAAQAVVARARPRWLLSAAGAGVFVGLAHALFAPLTLLAAPLAAGAAAYAQLALLPRRDARFVRGQGLAAAWAAMAWLLPLPVWAVVLLLLGAGLVSAWGFRAARA